VELDLSAFEGRVPVELLGRSAFPPIGELPYFVTLPAYGFYWFLLTDEAEAPLWHEPFVHPLEAGRVPGTGMVRGSNHVVLQAFDDRIAGRAIAVVALDNLVKGSAGQAIQNMNLMIGAEETAGLGQLGLFP